MSNNDKADDRREYFRIKNWIIINHQAVDRIAEDGLETDLNNSNSPRISLLQELTQLENDNQNYLVSLSDKQSQLGNYLINMNKKIGLLTRFVIQSLNPESQDLTEVDISGGGLRFKTPHASNIDQLLKLELVLIPECVGLIAYGRVVDCQQIKESSEYEIAVVFAKLREADRDAIIKHVFSLQSQQLRDENPEN